MSPLLWVALACVARADPTPASPVPAVPPAAPAPQEPAVTETIEETTVGDLDGTRVPMGNLAKTTYTRADGTSAEGWTCTLALASGPVVVGVGSAVTIDGKRWEVTAVEKPAGELGSVTLVRR